MRRSRCCSTPSTSRPGNPSPSRRAFPEAQSPVAIDHRDKPIVLVMDDAPEHREYAKRLLESEGYPVSLASTIAGALKTIHGGQELMIAFIDIHMHSGSL